MLDQLMQKSLKKRAIVVFAALFLTILGIRIALDLPVDVFPDLTAPTVTIMTECHGMAPEEVEMLVTFPIETAINGASGIRRVRSNSIQGLSTIWAEFEWGTDIFRARQIVNEKLQTIAGSLPPDIDSPVLAPITSLMGEIMLVGLTSSETPEMELRTIADFTLRRRLLAVTGVAQVLVYGGEVKQYQVKVDPFRLRKYQIPLMDVFQAVEDSNINAAGGLSRHSGQEYLIRGVGRIHSIKDLENSVVVVRNNIPVLLKHIADVEISSAVQIGKASFNGENGVLLVISKQPDTNTVDLTLELEKVLEESKRTLPGDVEILTDIFKQSDFIEIAVV